MLNNAPNFKLHLGLHSSMVRPNMKYEEPRSYCDKDLLGLSYFVPCPVSINTTPSMGLRTCCLIFSNKSIP